MVFRYHRRDSDGRLGRLDAHTARKIKKAEQTRAANTHPRSRQMLIPLRGHLSRPRPGAADEGR